MIENYDNRSARAANRLFLCVVSITVVLEIFVSLIALKNIKINIIANLMISQMIIMIPGITFYLVTRKYGNQERIFGRIRPISIFLLMIVAWLIMPLVTAANAFSQLFTTNEVVNVSNQILQIPMWIMVPIIGIVGPFCEEFVFRGLIYKNLCGRSRRYLAAGIVSGLFFGLMHLNLNQFCYAFILGIIFAMINEILDSIWPSFIIHAVINTQNVFTMYIMDRLFYRGTGAGISEYYNDYTKGSGSFANMKLIFLIMFAMISIAALFTTTLATLLLYGICVLEDKTDRFKEFFARKEKTEGHRLMYLPGYIAITFCIFVIFFLTPLVNLLKK